MELRSSVGGRREAYQLNPKGFEMKTLLLVAFSLSVFARDVPDTELLRISQLTLAGSTAADLWSSRGGIEADPAIGAGRFGARQVVTSAAITSSIILLENLLAKRYPKSKRLFAWVNFVDGAAHSYAVIHNVRIQ